MDVTAVTAEALSEADIIERLHEAGKTALSLPKGRYGPSQSVTMNIDVVRAVNESYGWNAIPHRFMPSPAEISRMEEALGWLELIDNKVVRQIVALRAFIHPITKRNTYSWRRLGIMLGADHKSIMCWHAKGIKKIILALDRIPTNH